MKSNDVSKTEINGDQPLNDDETRAAKESGQQEMLALYKEIQASLSGSRGRGRDDNMSFTSCYDEITGFNLLQEKTTKKLLAMEKQLYEYGKEAGLTIFREAINDFFYLERENLLEMESKGGVLFDTFRNNYLLGYGQSFFKEVAEYFHFQGVPSQPELLHSLYGLYYSNTLYPLYTYLYEDATKDRKRKIQSLMQKQGVTVKDLKKCSRVK